MKCPFTWVKATSGPNGSGHQFYQRAEYRGPLIIVRGIELPCGKCVVCRRNKAAEWSARLMHESEYYGSKFFLTLTYHPDSLPVSPKGLPTLEKSALQLFFKRLRKRLGKTKIKYFACGEYGERTERPHYHAIVFGWQPEDIFQVRQKGDNKIMSSVLLSETWGLGEVTIGAVFDNSIYYVAGYVLKKMGKQRLGDRLPPFLLCSQGLGLRYALDHIKEIEGCDLRAGARRIATPRYYLNKLGDEVKRNATRKAIKRITKLEGVVSNKYLESYGVDHHADLIDCVRRARIHEYMRLVKQRDVSTRSKKSDV